MLTELITVNPFDVLLWTFRRNESDVIKLYDSLSELMQVSTGGNILNFGYWDQSTTDPLHAQINLCKIIAKMADLNTANSVLDIGSGFSEPALVWKSEHPHAKLFCLNTNSNQLKFASKLVSKVHANSGLESGDHIDLINSTATKLPFTEKFVDRVISLESAQHFKPFHEFIRESRRVLTANGQLVMAIPIVSQQLKSLEIFKLGILSFTWSSEHYDFESLKKIIQGEGFRIVKADLIGSNVYVPLANYYIENREHLKSKISQKYPAFVEKILFKSMLKMKEVSEKGIIDYALVKCVVE